MHTDPLLLIASLLLPFSRSSQEGSPVESTPAGPGITVEGGQVRIIPIEARDDTPRLPEPRLVRASDAGDELLAPASGDPNFLGFAAGRYYPPGGERLDPLLRERLARELPGERPTTETYAFALIDGRITPAVIDALEASGARVLGFHPSNCLALALRPAAAQTLSLMPELRWLGLARPWQKIHPALQRELEARGGVDAAGAIPIWIDVFESDLNEASTSSSFGTAQILDPTGVTPAPVSSLPKRWRSHGWQESGLLALGVEPPTWVEDIRAFRTSVAPAALAALIELDYVQFVELDVESGPLHEESMPMVNADWGRVFYDGGTSLSVGVGEADWGVDVSHSGLNHFYGWGWNLGPGSAGPWADGCGHGSHVAGTILGNDHVEDSWQGAAQRIGWQPYMRFYNVKIGGDTCGTVNVDLSSVLDRFQQDVDDGTHVTPRPQVINHSWGSTSGGPWFGTEADARALDSAIFIWDQQHIFAAGNDGPTGQSMTLQASAKNTLSVGNANTYRDGSSYPGDLHPSSSRGPTGDLRWGPNLCAPGTSIRSVSANTGTGYAAGTGTSMAAPHVTGIAAQLCDRFSVLRHDPALLSAVMMAGSITKDSAILAAPSTLSTNHLNMYGTGRIDAYKAAGGNSQQAMYLWSYNQTDTGYGQLDFSVGAGATQVTVVMHYKERSASAGASSALVNDLDMYIDVAPFTAGGNTGEYFAQQSSRDNTEVRIVNNPSATDWRIKVYPENVTSGFLSYSKVGVCAIVTYADVTPAVTLNVSTPDAYVQPGDAVDLYASVTNPSYVASAVYLETTNLYTIDSAVGTLEDGATVNFTQNNHGGQKALLGNIRNGKTRTAHWVTHWNNDGVRTLGVSSHSDNAGVNSGQVSIFVDGTAPFGPTNFACTSHQVGFNCGNIAQLTWTAANDFTSGIDGYALVVNSLSNYNPTGSLNISAGATSANTLIADSPLNQYIHIRTRDRSGNWGITHHLGPYLVDSSPPYSYCIGFPNSVGSGGRMGLSGSRSVSANNLVLRATGLPAGQPCLFFYGPNEIQVPFGNGRLCVGGAVHRLPVVNTGSGTAQYSLNYWVLPTAGAITPGATWKFQNWYRDPAGGGSAFNLSDGLSIRFCP